MNLELQQAHTAIAIEAQLIEADELAIAEDENYHDDLATLAYNIKRYLELRDREEDLGQLNQMRERVKNDLKNTAVLYTDCIQEAFNNFMETQHEMKRS